MKNEPGTKILIVIVFIVLIIFTVYMSLTNVYIKNKVSSEPNITNSQRIDPEAEYYKSLDNGSIPYEEPNRNEEEYKRPTKEENVKRYYPNLPSKIKSLGFTDISNDEKCRDIDYCYTNNVYNVNFGSSVWTDISKDLNEGDINNYDSSKDFEFIGSLFDVKFPIAIPARMSITIIVTTKATSVIPAELCIVKIFLLFKFFISLSSICFLILFHLFVFL